MTGRAPHRLALAFAAALVVAALGACGDDDVDSTAAESTSTPAPTTTAPETTDPDPTTTTAPTTTTITTPAEPEATVIAHRGASAYAPEHTFAAYDLALEQGADYIEQDLQMTADGELVVLHDPTLDRTARGPAKACSGLVADKTLAQLRRCDVGSWFNEAFPEQADPAYKGLRIPTLRQVLDRYGADARYYIETKAPEEQPGMEEALVAVLDEADLPAADILTPRVVIQSFSAASLELVHSLRPDLPLVFLLPAPVEAFSLDEISRYAVGIGPSSAALDPSLIGAAHALCLVVHPYTVDDPAEMRRLLDAGVDGMFTNVPDRLLDVRDRSDPPSSPRCDPPSSGP